MYLRGKFGYTDMIKNLVFDFGGVLTAIDTKQAIERFRNLGLQNPEEYLNAYKQTGIFFQLENGDIDSSMDEIIIRSLNIKKSVVEQDEKETGLRRILNFGHTIGHGIESSANIKELYHGECVALGMLPMCSDAVRDRVVAVLKKYNLYRSFPYDWDKIADACFHDKKADGKNVTVTVVNEIGSFEIKTLSAAEIINTAKRVLEG